MSILDRMNPFKRGSAAPSIPQGASVPSGPNAAYFQNGRNPLMMSWRPNLRESQDDILLSWQDAAARSVEAFQNNGFLTKILEVETGSVVGPGLRFSSRPDADALGWTAEYAMNWSRNFEAAFAAYGKNPREIDASGRMTFAKMQQAIFGSYKAFGEILALTPVINRPGTMMKSKVMLLPPSRLSQENNSIENIVQGVKVDEWNCPIAYRIRRRAKIFDWEDVTINAFDRDGRPNVIHVFDSSIATTRGISPMANVLKVIRQVDQYADATLTSALIQTIFAATIKTDISGVAAFDGLMTESDSHATDGARRFMPFDMNSFTATRAEWYEAAKVDLTQHGRIAHLFPNDELEFTEAKQPGQQYDHFMGWLMREVAAGAGVTYESATGDYRGATYSSIRMGGAEAWLTVLRRRENLVVPFCEVVKDNFLDEAIYTGALDYPGGYARFLMQKAAASRGAWAGPAQPQADDFKAARAHQVLKDIGATTLEKIASAYGEDVDDMMRQQARENELARSLKLPLPWAPTDVKQTDAGLDAEIESLTQPEPVAPGKTPASAETMDLDAELNAGLEDD